MPQACIHTHTLTGLPIAGFASSVCRLHLPEWWTAFYQNNTLRPRHKQFMLLHTYRLDFSLQPIPDLLAGLHLFGNIFSCWKRENTTKLRWHIHNAHMARLTLLQESDWNITRKSVTAFSKVKGEPMRKAGNLESKGVHHCLWCHISSNNRFYLAFKHSLFLK